jgi:S-sulfo-L-cysteine synthase (O-acetyl-L-serine-dependent)
MTEHITYSTLEQTVGNTPLVQLQRLPGQLSDARGNVILGKMEGNNPAGSVKDRPASLKLKKGEISSLAIR